MIDQNQNKQPLPYATTKKALVTMYLDQLTEFEIIKNINTIIEAFGGKKNRKKVPHREFSEFVKTFGLPKNYYDPNTN
jgi:hypothetical protein